MISIPLDNKITQKEDELQRLEITLNETKRKMKLVHTELEALREIRDFGLQ